MCWHTGVVGSRLRRLPSLHVGLRDVGAVDLDVDLSVFFPFLLLFLEDPSVVDEVEGQQEAQHAQNEQSDVDLKGERES